MELHTRHSGNPVIPVFLVDDHPILLNGLQDLIRADAGLELAGAASCLEEAETGITATRPRVVVLDLFIGERESLPLIPRILRPGVTAVLTLSMSCRLGLIDKALRAGALGHVGKHEPPSRIIEGIRAVAAGELFLEDGIAAQLLRWRGTVASSGSGNLTDREREIFRMIGEGQTSPEIAHRLGVSAKTVETHKENIKRKLGAGSSSDLRKQAIQFHREGLSGNEPP